MVIKHSHLTQYQLVIGFFSNKALNTPDGSGPVSKNNF